MIICHSFLVDKDHICFLDVSGRSSVPLRLFASSTQRLSYMQRSLGSCQLAVLEGAFCKSGECLYICRFCTFALLQPSNRKALLRPKGTYRMQKTRRKFGKRNAFCSCLLQVCMAKERKLLKLPRL